MATGAGLFKPISAPNERSPGTTDERTSSGGFGI